MNLSRDFATVWLLRLLLASKWASLLKRTCELFGFRLTSMVSDGRSGNKSVVKSSPTLVTMAGVSTTRDRTALSICSGWLSHFLKEFDIGSKERTAIELKTLVRCLWLSGVHDQLNAPAHMLKTFLAPWNTHVVLIYRPFCDWVVSLHNQRFYRWPNFPPLTEWLTFDNIHAFASDTADVSFSMGLRSRYLAHGFRVTVLALN